MIIHNYDSGTLHEAFGIDMSALDGVGVGSGWGRVIPGGRSAAHQHDEIETVVIVQGSGIVLVDGARHPVEPGVVVLFDPFETHVIENTGSQDLVFVTFYWRDLDRAVRQSLQRSQGRFDDRPVFVFSTPPTPNGDLHLGHLSGPYLGADAYVRFQRMNGTQAWHLTGSDDFQSYVVDRGRREGQAPGTIADRYSREILETLRLMDVVPDQYTVTQHEIEYREGVQEFFDRLKASGKMREHEAQALFDPLTDEYLYEVAVEGDCPICGARTGGNICEECGEPNACADLLHPQARVSGASPRTGVITRFSLPLHSFAEVLQKHHKLGRVPARLRELSTRLLRRDELEVAITHPSSWGVPPSQADDAGSVTDGQVIWVWPEMSYGFLHGIQALGHRLGRDWQAGKPQSDWKIVHFFGYDNSFYHAVLYPVLYNLAFPGWAPDIDYHVNEFYLLDGSKFSTSRRHAVWGKQLLNVETVDSVRYFLSVTRPEGRRTNFTWHEYDRVLNQELIGTWQTWLNDLGRRVDERYGGVAPEAGNWTPEHTAFLARLHLRLEEITNALGRDGFSLNQAAQAIAGLAADGARFSANEKPVANIDSWADEARTNVALELAAARLLANCSAPLMPRFAAKLAAALSSPAPERWPDGVSLLEAGTAVSLVHEVFFVPRVDSSHAQDSRRHGVMSQSG